MDDQRVDDQPVNDQRMDDQRTEDQRIDDQSMDDQRTDDQAQATQAEVPAEESKIVSRPFRVKLRGSVLVLVRLPNRRDVRAAIHQLSVTGGAIHLEKPLDEKLVVEMIFHIGGTTIRAKAQMLFPMWATQGWMQPFRFVELSDASRESLDAHLKSYLPGTAKSAAANA